MARIFEPAPEVKKANDLTAMQFLNAKKANDYYKKNKQGFAVNDGKYLTDVDDREEADEYLKKLKKE
jgi:hypothetical protein